MHRVLFLLRLTILTPTSEVLAEMFLT